MTGLAVPVVTDQANVSGVGSDEKSGTTVSESATSSSAGGATGAGGKRGREGDIAGDLPSVQTDGAPTKKRRRGKRGGKTKQTTD